MHVTLLDMLRCPFCGTCLHLVDNAALARRGDHIESGVLGCECCAFPIVAGIPVLIADAATRDAMHALEGGRSDDALCALLGVDGARAERFRTLLAAGATTSYREALEILGPGAEGTYFLYRFSDPTFVLAEALIRAVGHGDAVRDGPLLDLCGGSGHLTRVLDTVLRARQTGIPRTVVADLHFWKLWLTTRFTAPGSVGVCCSADAPLPFTSHLFSMVVLMDAFPYIWHKRLCADEMMRVTRLGGLVALPHLHSARGENVNAGDPLSPAAYRNLFARSRPHMFSDTRLFDALVEDQVVDLSTGQTAEQLGTEPSLTLVASRDAGVYRRFSVPGPTELIGELRVNPLYAVERRDGRSTLRLTFPTPEYEAEFRACRRYLPDTLVVDADLTGRIEPALVGSRYDDLRRRHVLIDLPAHYC